MIFNIQYTSNIQLVNISGFRQVPTHQSDEYHFDYSFPEKSETFLGSHKLYDFLQRFSSEIEGLMLKQHQMNLLFSLCGQLVCEIKDANNHLMNDTNGLNPVQVVDLTADFACNELKKVQNSYKRNQLYISNDLYVPPQEKAVGTRWEFIRDRSGEAIPQIVQCTFQYISILETLQSLFKQEEFKSIYFVQNSLSHCQNSCVDGEYKNFCCGEVYKNTDLFQKNENCLQLQIATDDFEICNPLQSKAGIHKVCAVYFTIRNMPNKYLSKLKNIYLICLCTSDDLKSEQTDFNNLWSMISNEIKILENVGINIGNNINIKGTLAYLSFDNLGANVSLGLAEGFNTAYYCRICEAPKHECSHMCKENALVIRNKINYAQQLNIIASSEKVNYDETKGIKRYCALNDLKYFHIMNNISVDIMHDLNEGVMLFLMREFFNYCLKSKIFKEKELKKLINAHDYGYLCSKDKPSSKFNVVKKNLSQNAIQSKCLFVHLPYIFHDYENHPALGNKWICVQSLLRISQIVYSEKITESDLTRLEIDVETHLKTFKQEFNVDLIPKQHFMVHYSRVIRQMGPLAHMSMMRFESKHKYFKNIVRNGSNFANINKTMAVTHQQFQFRQSNTYQDILRNGRLLETDQELLDNMKVLLNEFFCDGTIYHSLRWFRCNNYLYKNGLIISYQSNLYEIYEILYVDDEYHFLCIDLKASEFNELLNSLKLVTSDSGTYSLIHFKDLVYKSSYEKKRNNGADYIMATNLELQHFC